VPPGVDDAAYVKAAFLAAIAKGEKTSPLVSPEHATKLLGTMLGGYNISPLVDLLDGVAAQQCRVHLAQQIALRHLDQARVLHPVTLESLSAHQPL
jgi:aconitase B